MMTFLCRYSKNCLLRNRFRKKVFEPLLAKLMGLTDKEISLEYESGNGKIFADRISWALSYLYNS